MTDDRRRDEDDHASDSTIGMAAADALAAADSNRRAESGNYAGATLDLPVEDQVAPGNALDPGKLIGRFVIRSRLGEGGMGVVLSGQDPDLGRAVAIKVVKESADHPAYRARLLREAQVMARLEHPNVLRVYEVGSDRGRLFLAMELVDGVTLWTWVKVQQRPWREIVTMFEQVGAGLSAVHRAGLVHRDFKPDNVLVDRAGRARVSDFGLARIDPDLRSTQTPDLAASLTKTGMLVGTPAYMAPEQYYGGDVDARADQYSFCVALREALTGKRVTKVDDPEWGKVPRAVRDVIDCGASVDVNDRFESMDELLDALRSAQRRTARMLGIVAGAAVLGAGVVATVVMLSRGDEATPRVVDQTVIVDAAISATPPDASVTAPPADATVVVTVTPDAVEQRTTIARDDRRAPAKPASGSATVVNGVVITPMAPVAETNAAKQHNLEGNKPPRHEMIAGHKSAVRDALHDFGFGGLTITGNDRDADFAELETKLAASTDDLERGVIMYAMGQTERLRGSCAAAAKQWSAARPLVATATRGPFDSVQKEKRMNQAWQFLGRIKIAEAFCTMLGGRALGIDEKLLEGLRTLYGSGDAERSEAWFALGIAYWETGDEEQGKQMLQQAARRGGAKVSAAVDAYVAAVGITF